MSPENVLTSTDTPMSGAYGAAQRTPGIAVRTTSYASSASTTLAVADTHVEVETSTRTTRQVGHRHSALA